MKQIRVGETTAANKRIEGSIVQLDGATPATGLAGGSARKIINGVDSGTWTNTLVFISGCRYYVELTDAEVAAQSAPDVVSWGYVDGTTLEAVVEGAQIVEDIAGYLEGQGDRSVTIQLYITATTTPIPGASVTVMNSLDNVFLSRVTTDANGQAVMARNDGTYKLRISCAGYTFTTPQTLTVSGDGTYTFYGDGIANPAPPASNMQNLIGYVVELDWSLAVGDVVNAYIARKQVVNSALVQNLKLSATVDSNGRFLLEVPCNAEIKLVVPHHGEYLFTTTSTNGTVNITTYIS